MTTTRTTDPGVPGDGEPEATGVGEALNSMVDAVVRDESRELSGPHVVMCTDRHSGYVTLSGPYPDGMSALVAADWEDQQLREIHERGFRFTVVPLLAPIPPAAVIAADD
jgi:hypothetical protein